MAQYREKDLGDILSAIREVEDNLDRRAARSFGAVLMIWGVVAAGIFVFYTVTELNAEFWLDAVGMPLLHWLWVIPAAAAYALTAYAGARGGRFRSDKGNGWRVWRLLGLLAVPIAITAALLVLDYHHPIRVLWVAFLGVLLLAVDFGDGGRVRTVRHGLAAAAFAGAVATWFVPFPWCNIMVAAFYGIGLVGLGTLKYARGE